MWICIHRWLPVVMQTWVTFQLRFFIDHFTADLRAAVNMSIAGYESSY